ncbi:hypothetical protein [Candidatus Sororendozoicomonas aggregata]
MIIRAGLRTRQEGADNVAMFQALIVICLLAGIDPYRQGESAPYLNSYLL